MAILRPTASISDPTHPCWRNRASRLTQSGGERKLHSRKAKMRLYGVWRARAATSASNRHERGSERPAGISTSAVAAVLEPSSAKRLAAKRWCAEECCGTPACVRLTMVVHAQRSKQAPAIVGLLPAITCCSQWVAPIIGKGEKIEISALNWAEHVVSTDHACFESLYRRTHLCTLGRLTGARTA